MLRTRRTFFTYLLTYVLVLLCALGAAYAIVQVQIRGAFRQTQFEQSRAEVQRIANIFLGELSDINKLTYAVQRDENISRIRYDDTAYAHIEATTRLRERVVGYGLIYDALYVDMAHHSTLSLNTIARLEGDDLVVLTPNGEYRFALDRSGAPTQPLSMASAGGRTLYLLTPSRYDEGSRVFYLIDDVQLEAWMNAFLIRTVGGAALVGANHRMLFGVGEGAAEALAAAPDDMPYETATLGDLTVFPTPIRGMTLAVHNDLAAFERAIDAVFSRTFRILLLAIGPCLLLIWCAMHMTYRPLRRMMEHTLGASRADDDLSSFQSALDEQLAERERLAALVRDYRVAVQRSLLDDGDARDAAQIDTLFSAQAHNRLAALAIDPADLSEPALMATLDDLLPADVVAFRIKRVQHLHVLLLDDARDGVDADRKDADRQSLIEALHAHGARVHASAPSDDALDIARLCDHALAQALPPADGPAARAGYPDGLLDALSAALEDMDHQRALEALDAILATANEDGAPEFFAQCLWMDAITLLIPAANQTHIRFDRYRDAFLKALSACRDGHMCRADEMRATIRDLFEAYVQEADSSALHIAQIKRHIQTHAFSPDFTITSMAEAFHVSVTYLSNLYKKRTGTTLSETLWQIRLERAKRYLQETDRSIDEISHLVGYDNVSSFRRKFKDETGMTPSQYRQIADR